MKKTAQTTPDPKRENVSIVEQFKKLGFRQKVSLFKMMRDDLKNAFQEQEKEHSDNASFIKENYDQLLGRG
jgi:hypothetical protein